MRQRLLQHLSFAKPLRLALVLSTLLTLPQTAWGKGYRTTGNVTDATGNNAGTRFIWETSATETTQWRWVIDCEQGTVTNNNSKLVFTLQPNKNITLAISGGMNANTVDYTYLRKLIFDGLSNDLNVSAYLAKESVNYSFSGSNGVFTPNNGWTQGFDMNGVLNITISNNSGNSVNCTINSITILTGPTISSDGLAWPADSPIDELTKTVSNNVTTLTGSCAADTYFTFPLKRNEGNNNLSQLTEQYDIAYTSSNTSVAEASSGGYVTIKGYGSTTITATLTENDYYSYEQSTYSYTLTNTQTIESYGITVAGTRVTSSNANNIFTDGPNKDKVTYTHNNDGTGTLTLNGATLTDKIRISREKALTIELIGANSITIASSDSSAIYANFEAGQAPTSAPSLFFKGEGYVTLTPGSTFPAIGGLSVNLDTYGMYAHGSLTTNGTSGSVAKKYDITVGGIQVTSENKNTVLANVSFTPASSGNNNTNTLTLNGAALGGTIESALDALTIEFTGNNSATYITSSNTSGALTIKSGTGSNTLSLASNSNDISAVNGFASVTLNGAYIKTDHGCSYISGNTRAYMQTPGTVNHPMKNMVFTTTHYYPLWINDIYQVHDGNKENIFNDGKASFDPDHNILTMNGVSIDCEFGLESGLSSLTINLIGDNSINTNTAYYFSPIYSHVANAALTIQKAEGAASAELQLSSSSKEPQVIKGFKSVSLGQGLNFASKTGSTISDASTKDAIITSATIYPLWVGGTLVTETRTSGTDATTSNIVWEYDATNNKLTLNNYSKTDNDGHAFISNMANLNVYLVGTNTVSKQALSSGKAFYTTYTDATLTFSTDENSMGTLNASGYDTFCEGFRTVNGIYCNNGLGYYPGSREIKAKATPTIKFAKRNQGTGDELSPTQYVGADETIQTAIGYVFKAPNPTFDNGYELFPDSTRYVYSYSVDGVVEFPTTGTNTNNPTRTDYGEINLLKAGTVTITCTFPGNMQNNPCSASYTLQVDKAILMLSGTNTPTTACICVDGSWHWGNAPDNYFPAPAISIPNDVTAFTYSSSNTDVATVNSTTGEVTPVGPGSATITLAIVDDPKYQDTNYPYDITVMVPATISFTNATASMLNTGTYTQTATTVPTGSTITYSSSNNNVNVDANGEVTISNPSFYGEVTITATVTAVPAANPQYYYVQSNNAAFQATYTLNIAKNLDLSSIFTDASMNYATCIMSESLTKPDGLKVYYITGIDGNTVTTQELDYLPYGIPILLEKTAATIGSVTARTDSSAVVSGNRLKYTTAVVPTTGKEYILYKNEFVKATGDIPTGKCYLDLSGVSFTRGAYGIGDGSTAIKALQLDAIENETWFDLQGRRIDKPTRTGLYIRNGKKVVVNNK